MPKKENGKMISTAKNNERNRFDELNKLLDKQRTKSKFYQRFYKKVFTDYDIERIADEMYAWFINPETYKENMWLKDFFIEIGINKRRMFDFEARNEYFKYMKDLCLDIQESKLVKLGLKNNSVISMVIFTLKNVAGWRDRIESNVGLEDEELRALKGLASKEMKSRV